MKILAVDDEIIQLERLKESILEEVPGCELAGFTNPLEACEWAGRNEPDIAFLDIQMPEMDGIALAKKLKSVHPKINLVFVTGYYAEYALEAMPLHFSGYLQKPVTAKKIRQELDALRFPLIREKPDNRIKGSG